MVARISSLLSLACFVLLGVCFANPTNDRGSQRFKRIGLSRRMAKLQDGTGNTADADAMDGVRSTETSQDSWCASMGGRHEIGSHKCFFIPDSHKSWIESENSCRTYGGHLASIISAAENEIVRDLYLANGGGNMWIGLSDAFENRDEGSWKWTDGNQYSFTSWTPGEPNDYAGEDCGSMWKDDGSWNDARCNNQYAYACAVDTRCNELGGQIFHNKCFFVPEQTATWQQGDDLCGTAYPGAHLASIHNDGENELVFGLYQSSGAYDSHQAIWIGFSDNETKVEGSSEGNWRWSDGSDNLDYNQWQSSRPPVVCDRSENCAAMWRSDKKWDDQACDNEFRFVCSIYTGPREENPGAIAPIWTGQTEQVISCDQSFTYSRYGGWYDDYYYYYFFNPVSGYYYYYFLDTYYDDYYYYYTYDFSYYAPHGCYDDFWLKFGNVDPNEADI